jgi:hypothetical protein
LSEMRRQQPVAASPGGMPPMMHAPNPEEAICSTCRR